MHPVLRQAGLQIDAVRASRPARCRAAATAVADDGPTLLSATFRPADPLAVRFWTRHGFRPVWHYYAAIVPTALRAEQR